jgi:hypothetical protein
MVTQIAQLFVRNTDQQANSVRQCLDENQKTRKVTYTITIEGKEVERTYYICEQCRKLPVFAEGIVSEEILKLGGFSCFA